MCVTVPLPYNDVISVVGSPQSQASHRTEASQVCSIFDLASSLQDLNYMFDLVQLTWWPHCRQVRLASNLGVPDWQSSGRALKARRTWPGWSNINRRIVINKKCKSFNYTLVLDFVNQHVHFQVTAQLYFAAHLPQKLPLPGILQLPKTYQFWWFCQTSFSTEPGCLLNTDVSLVHMHAIS